MADSLIFPVAGFMIVFLLGIIGWGSKVFFSDFRNSITGVMKKLDEIGTQLTDVRLNIDRLQTENQIQSTYIHDIEIYVREQVDRLDKRIQEKRDLINKNDKRIDSVERKVDKIFTFHGKNHPDDKL